MVRQRRYGDSNDSGSGGGLDLGSGGAGDINIEELMKQINSQVEELEKQLAEQEKKAETSPGSNQDEKSEQPDIGGTPPEAPGANPTDTGNLPPVDGSGIVHDAGSGYKFEFNASETAEGQFDITTYYPDGSEIGTTTGNFEDPEDALGSARAWFTGQLDENFEGWNDPNSYQNSQFPEQFPENQYNKPGGPGTDGEPDTEGDNLSLDIGDTDLKFDIGTTNQDFNELDKTIDEATATINDSESSEEDKEAKRKLLENIDANLVKGAEQLADLSAKMKDEADLKAKELSDTLEKYNSETDPAKQQELMGIMNTLTTDLNRVSDAFDRYKGLADGFNNRIAEDLANPDADLEKTDKSLSDYIGLGALVLTGVGATADLIEGILGDDEAPQMDNSQNMSELVSDLKKNLPEVIDLQKKLQPDLTNLDQTTKYQDTFGTNPFDDLYNKFNTEMDDGSLFLDSEYEKYLMGADGILGTEDDIVEGSDGYKTKSEWFEGYVRDNPNSEIAQDYAQSISRVGQDEKYLSEKLDTAGNLFKPTEEGGLGFTQDQFRTDRQKKVLGFADDLMGSPVNDMLEDSVMSELAKGGDMGDEYFNAQRDQFMGGLAPSLAKQSGLMSGGAQRFARKMTGDYNQTLMNRQNQAGNYLSNRNNQISGISNLINANTINPLQLTGLNAGNSQVYGQAGQPTGELLADPTTAYAGAVGQQRHMTDLLNYANQEDLSTSINKTANSAGTLGDVVKGLESWNKPKNNG